MSRTLVIVESPAKAKTISKFLGKNYMVKASMGHIVDLPRSQFGVDVSQDFKPKYITIRGKGKILQELREASKKADKVFLATDPDREGEAISWHLAQTLGLPEKANRIEFHEITRRAIEQAIKSPRKLDISKINAQQARRVLDRLVGYELSPLLWAKVRRGLSAGRVQSAAVRMICDREEEITQFVSDEYWTITGAFTKATGEPFDAKLAQIKGKKAEISNEETAKSILANLKTLKYKVGEVKTKERLRNPAPPFTTSTLQQEAARKLGFSSRKTMSIAQQLYEGLELGEEGSVGLISYIRTDSVRIAQEASEEAAETIRQRFGGEYVPEKPPVYKTKAASAQEAHEAIRPTSAARTPQSVKAFLTRDQYRLYQLVWNRFIASQMRPAIMDTISVEIIGGDYLFRATGMTVKFPGFLVLYQEGADEEVEEEGALPIFKSDELVKLKTLDPKQHFTQPPPRYTEAMLIRALEEMGIGRPSTYAPTIETILKRNYVTLEEKRFHPTELGQVVVDLLKEHFPEIVDPAFTAEMEEKLDQVEDGEIDWVKVIHEFYKPFSAELEVAKHELDKIKVADEVSEEVCEHCGRNMVYKYGRFGKFLACPGYPECKNTKPIRKETKVACPLCGNKIIERRTKKGRRFFGCSTYPECTFTQWNAPAEDPCPVCGSFCSATKSKDGITVKCLREGCGYEGQIQKEDKA